MSTDYRYTIRRKADDKEVASFYYNSIKSLYEISGLDCGDVKLDPESINDRVRYTVDDISNDITKLEDSIKILNMKIFEKKLLAPTAANRDVKTDIEADIYTLETEVKDALYALEALAGLKAVICTFVEDAVRIGKDGEDNEIAYEYNAEGLPKTAEGYEPHLWASDVYVEAKACC